MLIKIYGITDYEKFWSQFGSFISKYNMEVYPPITLVKYGKWFS